jgi:hypothetical protein
VSKPGCGVYFCLLEVWIAVLLPLRAPTINHSPLRDPSLSGCGVRKKTVCQLCLSSVWPVDIIVPLRTKCDDDLVVL